MRTIFNMLESALKIDLPLIFEVALIDSEQDYVKLQKDQMFHGLNSDDAPIGQYKNPLYAARKNTQNPTPGFGIPDLRLTGEFYAGIFADPRSEGIVVDSLDYKADELMAKYSDKIFTLGPTRLPVFNQIVQPKIIEGTVNALNRGNL